MQEYQIVWHKRAGQIYDKVYFVYYHDLVRARDESLGHIFTISANPARQAPNVIRSILAAPEAVIYIAAEDWAKLMAGLNTEIVEVRLSKLLPTPVFLNCYF